MRLAFLGYRAAGISAGPLLARFYLQKPIIKVAPSFERALIARLQQFPNDLRLIDRRKFEQQAAPAPSLCVNEVEALLDMLDMLRNPR